MSLSTGTATLDPAAVDKLAERIQRDVDNGMLPAAQFALGLDGEIVEARTFGEAGPDTRFCLFSATKPLVAATVWRLIGEGDLDPALPVTTWFPAFGANGKQDITLEQVLLHQSGFPYAPMGPAQWGERATRQARMASWRLNWEPGTRFEYHPTAAHWVLGELIETVTGTDFRDAVQSLVTDPLGLPRLLGIPLDQQDDIADLVLFGEPATSEELMAAFGVPELPATEVTDDAVLRFNEPAARAVGVPGGGGFARAADMALFYQRLLHGQEDVWPPTCSTTRPRMCATASPVPTACRPTARSVSCSPATTGSRTPAAWAAPCSPGRVRARRCRWPDLLGRSGHRPVVRVRDERLRPP